jgi:hypothetical protein
MICIPCRKNDHDSCVDNPRKLAFNMGEVKGIKSANAGEWCYCHHVIPAPPTEHDTDRLDC